jgi:hypothetical protein
MVYYNFVCEFIFVFLHRDLQLGPHQTTSQHVTQNMGQGQRTWMNLTLSLEPSCLNISEIEIYYGCVLLSDKILRKFHVFNDKYLHSSKTWISSTEVYKIISSAFI